MSAYSFVRGTIIQMNWPNTGRDTLGCTVTLTLQSGEQGIVNVNVPSTAYVLNSRQLNTGDLVTCFYSSSAPMPLIYPPLYTAVAVAHTPSATFAELDSFDSRLVNSDNTLRLNIAGNTRVILPNGQRFAGFLEGKTLLVIYGNTTRSIPAQTTPSQIVVFCVAP